MRKIGKNTASIRKIVFIVYLFVFIVNNHPIRGNQGKIQYLINDSNQIGSDWVEMSPAVAPPARYHHWKHSAYDSQSDRIILCSGDNGTFSKIFNDTWAYDYNTDTWENLTTPEMRKIAKIMAAVAYDSESDRIIMFGGWKWAHDQIVYQSTGVGETWSYDYDSNTWENLTTENSPPFRGGCTMSYDKANDKMIMFGGINSDMNGTIPFYQDTWVYDYNNNIWTNMSPIVSPPPLATLGSAYDSESDKMIIFGGRSCMDGVDRDETWAYDYKENTWTNMHPPVYPSKRCVCKMIYNSRIDRILLFAGVRHYDWEIYRDTWSYDYNTNTWTDMNSPSPPSDRHAFAFNYDSESDVAILFGGSGGAGVLNDTWAYHYQANVPSKPLYLQVTEINGEANLTWSAPLTCAGSPITEYIIYRGNKSDSLTLYKTIQGKDTLEYIDADISKGGTYFYTVCAKNSIGESETSNVVSITISSPGVPGFSLVLASAIMIYLVVLRRKSSQ
ncbi:MAG: kelch repeat-containing protein [Promethearchaeota archaeon]